MVALTWFAIYTLGCYAVSPLVARHGYRHGYIDFEDVGGVMFFAPCTVPLYGLYLAFKKLEEYVVD